MCLGERVAPAENVSPVSIGLAHTKFGACGSASKVGPQLRHISPASRYTPYKRLVHGGEAARACSKGCCRSLEPLPRTML